MISTLTVRFSARPPVPVESYTAIQKQKITSAAVNCQAADLRWETCDGLRIIGIHGHFHFGRTSPNAKERIFGSSQRRSGLVYRNALLQGDSIGPREIRTHPRTSFRGLEFQSQDLVIVPTQFCLSISIAG